MSESVDMMDLSVGAVPGTTRSTYDRLKAMLEVSSVDHAVRLQGPAAQTQRVYRSLYMWYWRQGLRLCRARRDEAMYVWIEER
jgi:hypothetical protein